MTALLRRWADRLVDIATEDDNVTDLDSVLVRVAVPLYRLADLLGGPR